MRTRAYSLPWVVAGMVFASFCITYGILWDISWHATIGRDSFWTPAHMMIYLGGTLGGCLGGWLAFRATFIDREGERGRSVSIFGARAPVGAWVAIWGAVAMLTSAPFDDWWHNTYGLDVKILSPPHALLAMGMYGVVSGALILVASERNRAAAVGGTSMSLWVILAFGIQLALASILLTELSLPNLQRTQTFYWASAAMYPTFLCASAGYKSVPWCATRMAGIYMVVLASMVWILPLFPAEPQLAPVYNRVTHMVPPAFPLLLILPALVIDGWFYLWRSRTGWGWLILRALGATLLFVAVFVPVQWWFSKFLISPGAENAFFGGKAFFSYGATKGPWWGEYWRLERDPFTWRSVPGMLGVTFAAGLLGCLVGSFLHRVRR